MERKTYLNRYRVWVDQIGLPIVIRRSASEATFKAEDSQTNAEVALQVVPVASLRSSAREQLQAEADSAKQISHINIPALLDFGFEGDQLIYVTEYFDGTTAEDWVKEHGPMPVGAVMRIAAQVVSALTAATFRGITHHALNPTNLMLVPGQTAEGEWPLIKVLNFVGVAPSFARSGTPDPRSLEAVNFASPEQLESGTVNFRSELYSLGCTLWFLLSGAAPLAGAASVANGHRVPNSVRKLLAQMMAADPEDRPLDPLIIQEQIQHCVAQLDRRDAVATKFGLAPASAVAAAPAVTAVPRRPIPWKPLAIAALVLSLIGLGAMMLPSRNHEAIGVPVGVPEKSTAPAVASTTTSLPTAPAATEQTTTTAPPAVDPASEPPVMTSNLAASDAPPDEGNSEPAAETAAAPQTEQPTEVAANNAVPTAPPAVEPATSAPVAEEPPQQPAPVFASNSNTAQASDPAPPAEGPAHNPPEAVQPKPEVASASEESPREQSDTRSKAPQRVAKEDSDAETSTTAKTKPREKTTTVASTSKSTSRKSRSEATADEPPIPRGAVRAQFLGTTPDGNLVFGLPSDERGYVTPPPGSVRSEPSRRPVRREVEEEPVNIDNLPVLPALPADGE